MLEHKVKIVVTILPERVPHLSLDLLLTLRTLSKRSIRIGEEKKTQTKIITMNAGKSPKRNQQKLLMLSIVKSVVRL